MTVHVSAGNLTGISVINEYLNATDPRVGLAPNSTSDQTAKLQAAIDMVAPLNGAGALFLPAGEYRKSGMLAITPNRAISIYGAGSNGTGREAATVIRDMVDLGQAGAATTNWSISNTNTHDCQIEKIRFLGPGYAATRTAGTPPALMGGIWQTNRLRLVDVAAEGYYAGLGVIEDHQEFYRCDFRRNGVGMFFLPGTFGLGDQHFHALDLRDQTMANVLVSPSGQPGHVLWNHCRFGDAPYGILRMGADESTRSVMSSIVFLNCPIEPVGNGFILDFLGDAGADHIHFIGGRRDGWGGDQWAGMPSLAWIDVLNLSQLYVWGDMLPYVASVTAGDRKAVARYQTYTESMFRDPGTLLDDVAAGTAEPFLYIGGGAIGGGSAGVHIGQVKHGGQRACVMGASEAIEQGDLLTSDDYTTVQVHDGSDTKKVIGVALQGTASGDPCVVWLAGPVAGGVVKVATGATVSAWQWLKASAEAGAASGVASIADANVVGRCVTAGGTGPATVAFDPWLA